MIPVTGAIIGQNIVVPVYFVIGETYVMTVSVYNQEQITTFSDLTNVQYPASLGQSGIITPGYVSPLTSLYFTFSGTSITIVPENPVSTGLAPLFYGTMSPVFQSITVESTVSAAAASSSGELVNLGQLQNGTEALDITTLAATVGAFSGTVSASAASGSGELATLGQANSLYQSSLVTVSSVTASGDVTASASDLAGQYLSDGATQTADFTVTTDTAVNILAVIPNAVVGTAFKWRFINNDQSSTGYAGTLAGGTGVTIGSILPNPAVGQGNWCDYIFTFTAVGSTPTITVEAVGGSSLGLL